MSIDTAVTTDATSSADVDDYPRPPSLHCVLVLVLWLFTCGISGLIWISRQAAWVRRIDPASKALLVLVSAFACTVMLPTASVMVGAGEAGLTRTVLLARLGFAVAWVWSYFSMRRSLEERFGVSLSGILTFFFPVFYLQHHMTHCEGRTHTASTRSVSLTG